MLSANEPGIGRPFRGKVMKGGLLVCAEGLSKAYGAPVFTDISFSLKRGQALGVMGGNGSGKTTLLNIIAGLERQSAGTLYKNGKIGYVMQKAGLFPRLSCLDNMRYVCALNSMPKGAANLRIAECAELCGIGGFLRKKVRVCSGGMRQRLNIALALLPDPDLLLLDEAAAGLDAAARDALRRILNSFLSGGRSVLMVSHYKEEMAGICHMALNMETGAMVNV